MSDAARAKLLAASLLCLFVFAVTAQAADWYGDTHHRHVTADVSNVDDSVWVHVNCRLAAIVSASEGPQRVDLGRLSPDDRIYISVYNKRGGATWNVRMDNGNTVRTYSNGHAGVTGRGEPFAFAMAKMLTADGDRVGTLGCVPPNLVSDSVTGYQESADADAVSKRAEEAPLWNPPTFPFVLIEDLGGLVPFFAAAGFLAALGIGRVRRLLWGHRVVRVVFGAFELFLAVLGLMKGDPMLAFLVVLEGTGLMLLLVSAVVTAWPHTGSRWLSGSSTPDPKPNPE